MLMSTIKKISFHPVFAIILAMLAMQSGAFAQTRASEEISVEVELSRSSVYVGDELSYQVIVRGAKSPQAPEIRFPDTVRAQFHGRSSQSFTNMQIVDGVQRAFTDRRFIFQYTLTALSEGVVEIPAPLLPIDGNPYRGEPTSFQSLLPVLSDEDNLEMSIDRTQLYLNETVEVECVWWIADNTSEFNLASSMIPGSFEIRPSQSNTGGQYKIDFNLDGQSMSGFVETDTHNGREMSRFSFRFTITPTETGSFELGPMRSIFTRHSGTGSRFRAYVESNSLPIEVVPVPGEARPDQYDGAIGSYQLVARASNTNVNVGDPINLTLRIRGNEPMVGVNDAPDLAELPEFKDQFKIDSDGWREVAPRKAGLRLYETTIRAIDDRASEIPSIELPSFIPETGEFTVFKTDPIPLNVRSVREITLADAVVHSRGDIQSNTPIERVDRIELSTAAPGLWAHGSAEDLLHQPGFNLAQTLTLPGWQATLIAPPSIFFSVWFAAAYIRSRDPDRVRLNRAYSIAKRRSGVESLRCYIALSLLIDTEAVSASDARLLPIEHELQSQVYEMLLGTETVASERSASTNTATLLRDVHSQCVSQFKEVVA